MTPHLRYSIAVSNNFSVRLLIGKTQKEEAYMAFEEYQDDRADFTVSLGGTNKKTGKANPTSVEGYYLGSKRVPDDKKKTGYEWIHRFQTQKGTVDVWGKTDMNKKMKSARLGVCVKIEATGETKATKNGDMKIFKVLGD